MAYTPQVYVKTGYPDRTAYTQAEAYQLVWEGWRLSPDELPPPPDPWVKQSALTAALDAAAASANGTFETIANVAAVTSRVTTLETTGAPDPTSAIRDLTTWHTLLLADDNEASDGAKVGTVPDGSGNNRAAIQTTTADQPYIVDAKAGTKRSYSFNGSGDHVRVDFATLAQPFSFVVVGNFRTGVNGVRMVTGLSSTDVTQIALGVSSGGELFASFGTNILGTGGHTDKLVTAVVVADGANSLLRINGTQYTGNLGTSNLKALLIGAAPAGAQSIAGNVPLVGLKAGRFTAGEITSIEAAVTDYYDLDTFDHPIQENWSWWTRPRAVYALGRTYVPATGRKTDNTVNIFDGSSRIPTKVRAGTSGGAVDDHNNGSLVLEPGRVPILFYAQHGTEFTVKYRRGTLPFEQDPDLATVATATEQTFASTGSVTYPSSFAYNGNIWVWYRDGTTNWSLAKSTDWGATFGTPVRIVQHTGQLYCAAKRRGNTLRVAVSTHPVNGSDANQDVYYFQINLDTGSITKSDGTVLGNLDGTSLPIAITSLELVATPAVGKVTWAYDVSDGPTPEVLWLSFTNASRSTTSTYHYSTVSAAVWTTRDLVGAGADFASGGEPYFGGIQAPHNTPGGKVYLCRESTGTWYVERWGTRDNGVTWQVTEMERSSASALVRAWPVEARDGARPPHELMINQITRFSGYTDMDSTVRPVA